MSMSMITSLSRASLAVLLLAACGDDGSGTGGTGGLEPCTETCASSSGGDGDGGDATASTGTGDGGASTGSTTDASSSSQSSSSGEGGSGDGGGAQGGGAQGGGEPGEGLLVVNELSAAGDDWIELYNAGDADLDVGGLRIADQEEPGVPKLDEAIEIPAGTMLEAGAYLFILADQDEASVGFVDQCDPGPAPCLVSAFGLSGGGDEVFVVDADDAIVLSVPYPADATVEGESWGRLPNGTGDFEVNAPTPGTANEAP